MKKQNVRHLVHFTITTRLLIILWTIFTNLLVTNYDTSSAFPCDDDQDRCTDGNHIVNHMLASFSNWDSLYFLRIAKVGFYEYEHFHAFFPLYPFAIRLLAKLILLGVHLQESTAMMLSGICISNVCFVLSVIILYKLSCLFFDERYALVSAKIYALNPAAIFMSAIYTESIFAVFSLAGMYLVVQSDRSNSKVKEQLLFAGSVICFSFASLTRGNGIVCCGFIGYFWMKRVVQTVRRSPITGILFHLPISIIFSLIIPCIIIIAPYLSFQYFGFNRYCTDANLHFSEISDWNQYISVNHPWCINHRVPHLYNYVQEKYWGVGFLKYYETKQIPNFILAAPIILISVVGIIKYLLHDKYRLATLSFLSPQSEIRGISYKANNDILVFVCYWAALIVTGLFFMHVQVTTRFIASCPPLYWFITSISIGKVQMNATTKAIGIYFLLYNLAGPALFSNFYPWT